MSPDQATRTIALVGNPNAGKTTLFNALTGLSARVANYPGITVEHLKGALKLPGGGSVEVLDLPGTYSLVPRSEDEAVAVRGVLGTLPHNPPPDLVVAVVDVTHLERNLYLVRQLWEVGAPMVVALTLQDVAERDGVRFSAGELSRLLGVPVFGVSGKSGAGMEALVAGVEDALKKAGDDGATPDETDDADGADENDKADPVQGLFPHLQLQVSQEDGSQRRQNILQWGRAVCAAGTLDLLHLPEKAALRLCEDVDPTQVEEAIAQRYGAVAHWTQTVLTQETKAAPASERWTDRVDRWVLHPVLGPGIFLLVFGLLFQALFAWADPLIGLVEAGMEGATNLARGVLPEGALFTSLVTDGIIAGVGNVVVFVPQIAILFLFLGLLEDSGYLARAAFLLDRLMARVGLHGRAFVPLLSGFACAVPAILATRTIENRKDRLVTILVTPLMSCSARLPVYGLMIATAFASVPPLFGVVAAGTVVMFAMYGLGVGAALAMAFLFKRTLLKSPTPPLVLELPTYRRPQWGGVLRHTWGQLKVFLTDAGTVILAITIVLWGLFSFPQNPQLSGDYESQRAALSTTASGLSDADLEAARLKIEGAQKAEELEKSYAGQMGRLLEPLIKPLGFDWKIGVGLVASFAAREVMVSTLGLVYGLGEVGEEAPSLREALKRDRDPASGKPRYSPLTALSLMVFFVLAMQCMSTLAAVRRETRSFAWPAFQFAYMSVLAWVASFVVFQVGRMMGFG
jgi:ferrous iron transport protein B